MCLGPYVILAILAVGVLAGALAVIGFGLLVGKRRRSRLRRLLLDDDESAD